MSPIRPPIELLGVPMHPWTMDETVGEITRRIEAGQFTQHVVINVAKLVGMHKDPALRESVLACDIINIDGMGVVWGARWLGSDVLERVAGIDLFLRLLGAAEQQGWPVYLLGARPGVVERAVERLSARFPHLPIAGFHHGYFWDDEAEVVQNIRSSGAKLLFVAITSPKKERFINRWREELGVTFAMGVGGSFDVMAGITRRAPVWMQHAGLEWLFRMLQEPRRMASRYLLGNARFAVYLIRERLRGKHRLSRGRGARSEVDR